MLGYNSNSRLHERPFLNESMYLLNSFYLGWAFPGFMFIGIADFQLQRICLPVRLCEFEPTLLNIYRKEWSLFEAHLIFCYIGTSRML